MMSAALHDHAGPVSSSQGSRPSFLTRAKWTAYLVVQQRRQARFPFQSRAVIERAQRRRVRRIVAHAHRHVPYYRETMRRLKLQPGDFRTAEDLARLPVLEREQLQRDPEYFVSRAEPIDRYLRIQTSGSTGAPRQIFHDGRAIVEGNAHLQRFRSIMTELVGKRYSAREAIIVTASSTFHKGHEFLERYRLIPSGPLGESLHLSVFDPPERNLELLNEFRPDLIQGYGSYFEELFARAHATGRAFHRPRLVVFWYDGMSRGGRRLISEVLGIPILSVYGAAEAFHIGFECERSLGYHLNIDLVAPRIVGSDGRELPAGESGEVIVSNLVNRATVLLNYRLGDLATRIPGTCSCGRSLPLLSFPEGRSEDWLETASGELLHPSFFSMFFKWTEDPLFAEIWQWQVVQLTPRHLRVTVVTTPSCDHETIRKRIVEKLGGRLGEGTTVDVEFVDRLPRTSGGKVRTVQGLKRRETAGAVPETPVEARRVMHGRGREGPGDPAQPLGGIS